MMTGGFLEGFDLRLIQEARLVDKSTLTTEMISNKPQQQAEDSCPLVLSRMSRYGTCSPLARDQ